MKIAVSTSSRMPRSQAAWAETSAPFSSLTNFSRAYACAGDGTKGAREPSAASTSARRPSNR